MIIRPQEDLETTTVTQRPTGHKSTLQASHSHDIAKSAILPVVSEKMTHPNFGSWLVVEVSHPENVYLALNGVLLVQGIDGTWRAWMRMDGEV